MEAQYDSFEIARVIHGFKLIDAESYERRYDRREGLPLAPGYYVVNWSEAVVVRRFNEDARFYGPFRLRQEAAAFLDRLRGGVSTVPAPFTGHGIPSLLSRSPETAVSESVRFEAGAALVPA